MNYLDKNTSKLVRKNITLPPNNNLNSNTIMNAKIDNKINIMDFFFFDDYINLNGKKVYNHMGEVKNTFFLFVEKNGNISQKIYDINEFVEKYCFIKIESNSKKQIGILYPKNKININVNFIQNKILNDINNSIYKKDICKDLKINISNNLELNIIDNQRNTNNNIFDVMFNIRENPLNNDNNFRNCNNNYTNNKNNNNNFPVSNIYNRKNNGGKVALSYNLSENQTSSNISNIINNYFNNNFNNNTSNCNKNNNFNNINNQNGQINILNQINSSNDSFSNKNNNNNPGYNNINSKPNNNINNNYHQQNNNNQNNNGNAVNNYGCSNHFNNLNNNYNHINNNINISPNTPNIFNNPNNSSYNPNNPNNTNNPNNSYNPNNSNNSYIPNNPNNPSNPNNSNNPNNPNNPNNFYGSYNSNNPNNPNNSYNPNNPNNPNNFYGSYNSNNPNNPNNSYNPNNPNNPNNFYNSYNSNNQNNPNNSLATSNPLQIYYFPKKGLYNIGSTCYMNATLQCLLHVSEIDAYFLNEYKNDYSMLMKKNNNVESQGNISKAFYGLVKGVLLDDNEDNGIDKMNKLNVITNINKSRKGSQKSFLGGIFNFGGSSRSTAYSPDNFKRVLGIHNAQFRRFEANDSKDLILYLLQTMHEELNYYGDVVLNRNMLRQPNQFNRVETFFYFNNTYNMRNFSIISNVFYGTYENTTICYECKNTLYNFQKFEFISFGLYDYNRKSFNIYDGFKDNQKESYLRGDNQFYCCFCKRLCDAIITCKIIQPPNKLLINLDYGKNKKYQPSRIYFDENIDITNFVNFNFGCLLKYRIIGVCTHYGYSGSTGHYIAFCRHRETGDWYKFNDSSCYKCGHNEIYGGSPYLLLYERII